MPRIRPDAGRFEDIAAKLRPFHAVLVAFERAGVRDVHFDFEGDIAAGDKIFYIASQRPSARLGVIIMRGLR